MLFRSTKRTARPDQQRADAGISDQTRTNSVKTRRDTRESGVDIRENKRGVSRYTAYHLPNRKTICIHPDKEYETLQRLQAAYGKKFDSGMLAQSRMDVAKMLSETAEPVSIRQKLQQLQGQQNRRSHEKERSQER